MIAVYIHLVSELIYLKQFLVDIAAKTKLLKDRTLEEVDQETRMNI